MSWSAMRMAVSVVESDPRLAGGLGDREDLSAEDLTSIRGVIRRQIVALLNGDLDEAWSLCSPHLKTTFPTAAELGSTVRYRYQPLLTARQLGFGELHFTPAGLGLVCRLTDDEGDTSHAVYVVERQPDGAWAILGCIMLDGEARVPGVAA